MANGKRYVELMVPWEGGMQGLGVHYDTRNPLNSNCFLTHSKYLCLAQGSIDIARFILSPEGDGYPRCSLQFYDGPYEAKYVGNSGDYLYVLDNKPTNLAADFNDSGDTLILSVPGYSWFRRGGLFKSVPSDCGMYYYVGTWKTTDGGSPLEFQITEFKP